MILTLALIFGISTLLFAVVLSFLGIGNIAFLILMVVGFNLVQWLFAPYLVDMMYRVEEASASQSSRLHQIVQSLSVRTGVKTPKIMIADIPIPNAFAYGSPLTGNRIAVTRGLLQTLETEEVEAVIGHELGHLKHRDVQVMMLVSVLPALFYYLGYSMMLSGRYRDEEKGTGAMAIGFVSMLAYWVLTLFALNLSRLREYYADRHSASIVEDGARKLSEALAKIASYTGRINRRGGEAGRFSNFKALFIADPDRAETDAASMSRVFGLTTDSQLVQDILVRRITAFDRIIELFSSHPNIVNRLRALQSL